MTQDYSNLRNRINEIGNNFKVIIDDDPITQAEQKNQDFIRSYILLCHAEFEKYFESIVKTLIDNLKINVNECEVFAAQKLFALNKIIENSTKLTETNNGIKIMNLKKLFEPTGFDTENLDDVYVTKINSFAKKRCEIAHNGEPLLCRMLSFEQEKSAVDWLMQETEQQIDEYFSLFSQI